MTVRELGVRLATGVAATVVAVVVQPFLVVVLATQWVMFYNVAGGECGWDGTVAVDIVVVIVAWLMIRSCLRRRLPL